MIRSLKTTLKAQRLERKCTAAPTAMARSHTETVSQVWAICHLGAEAADIVGYGRRKDEELFKLAALEPHGWC